MLDYSFEGYLWTHVGKRASEMALMMAGPCLVAQSCPTPCDPMDCSSPGSSVHGDSPGKSTGVGCYFLTPGLMYNSLPWGVRWTWRLTSTKEALAK